MNFFLDENFPKSAEDYLQLLGHQTFSTRSTDLEGIDDISIFTLAIEKKCNISYYRQRFFPYHSIAV